MWRQYTCYFPANGSTNPDVFYPKTKGNHPSKFQLAGVCRFGWVREHPNRQTDRQTHSLTDWCFDREISIYEKYLIYNIWFALERNIVEREYTKMISITCLCLFFGKRLKTYAQLSGLKPIEWYGKFSVKLSSNGSSIWRS